MDLKFLEIVRLRPVPPVVLPAVLFEGLAQVRAYWEGLRQQGRPPARTDLDPRGLSGMLDRVFIAERIGRGVVQVRIAGSGLADFAGLDLRGLPLSCLFAAEARPLLGEVVEDVCQTPSIAEFDLGSDRDLGATVARLLLLPLADDSDRKLMLGAISFAPGKTARCRFQILRRQSERLLPEIPVAAAERSSGHLRLVHSRAD